MTEEAKFVGWARRSVRHKWEPRVTAADDTAALFRLLDAAPGWDKIVLPAGRDPNNDARPR